MQPITIHFPGKLIVGSGTLSKLKEELLRIGAQKVLFITIQPLLTTLHRIIVQLSEQKIECAIDVSIVREPYFSDFQKLLATFGSFAPDVVVGIGGGSVLDVAKLVAAQIENEQSLEDYVGIGLLKGRKKGLI